MENGITVAANTGGPRFEGDLFSFELEVTLLQDSDEPESLIYEERGFAWDDKGFFMDADGVFYVRDRGNGRVAAFDASGRYVKGIGRIGPGPGEFGNSFELITVADGVIEVYDPGPRRFTRYSADGMVQDMVSAPIPGFRIRYDREAERFTNITSAVHLGSELITSNVGFRTVDKNGETIASASTEAVPERYAYPWDTRTGIGWTAVPFAVQPFGAYAPDGSIVLVQSTEPVVWWYQPDGTVMRKITMDIPVGPIDQRDLDAHFDELGRTLEEGNAREKMRLERMRQSVWAPEHRAYWSFVTIDDRGYVWLEVFELASERSEQGGGTLYHVLSPQGEFLGSTRSPAAGKVMRGHLLGTVTESETGRVDYTVWRMTSEPDGFNYR